jgi:hypothetical protein
MRDATDHDGWLEKGLQVRGAVLGGGDPLVDGVGALSKGEHEGRDPA